MIDLARQKMNASARLSSLIATSKNKRQWLALARGLRTSERIEHFNDELSEQFSYTA
jgi:hypothetical protein